MEEQLTARAGKGGVVLIDRATGAMRFRTGAPMAHSADVLPAAMSRSHCRSTRRATGCSCTACRGGEAPLASLPLPPGHGAVWDAKRQRLFALSHDLIQGFAFDPKAPARRPVETPRWTLPGRRDGHDLSPTPEGGYVVTTDDGVWRFDPDRGDFAAIPALNPKLRVKAVSVAKGQWRGCRPQTAGASMASRSPIAPSARRTGSRRRG